MQEHKEDRNVIEQGFTLIELLVVIAILGILAAVVVFSVNGITQRGHNAACTTEVSTIQTALEAYDAQNGNYPAAAASGTPAATAAALNVMAPPLAGAGTQFLDSALTGSNPSIAAGFRYTTAGQYTGGTCPAGT